MHIGLTYDLRQEYLAAGFSDEETGEFDRISTVEALEGALAQLGHSTERIGHIQQLTQRLVDGAAWDLDVNGQPRLNGFGRAYLALLGPAKPDFLDEGG